MDASFFGRDGKLKPFVMGCYGIGITRIMSAVIEQLHDEKGIIWPPSISPIYGQPYSDHIKIGRDVRGGREDIPENSWMTVSKSFMMTGI